MSDAGKLVRGVIILLVTAALGILFGWLASRHGDIAPVSAPVAVSNPSTTEPVVPEAAKTKIVPTPAVVKNFNSQHSKHLTSAELHEQYEQKLETILLGAGDENDKADQLIALIPSAPDADVRQELTQHLVNMVQDDHYNGAAEMLTNSSTAADVSDILMNDLLNRNNNLKLPLLLSIARNDTHPLKDQALDLLGLLTQEDNGTNWDQWSTTVDTWLQNNPQ